MTTKQYVDLKEEDTQKSKDKNIKGWTLLTGFS